MRNHLLKFVALLFALTLTAAACSDNSEDTETDAGEETEESVTEDTEAEETEDTTEDTTEETTEDTMEEGDDSMEEGEEGDDAMEEEGAGTVVDVAVESGQFPTLVAAIEAAGLGTTLSDAGPYTVFAPTEDAFTAALESLGVTADELLADPELEGILTYHVIPGSVLAADVAALDGTSVATVNGAEVAVAVAEDGTVTINEATVVDTDITADNGVIHVIDTVLLPPSE